jgi:hypothetical protein
LIYCPDWLVGKPENEDYAYIGTEQGEIFLFSFSTQ